MKSRTTGLALGVFAVVGLIGAWLQLGAQAPAPAGKPHEGFVFGKFAIIERNDGGLIALERPEVRSLAGHPYVVGRAMGITLNRPLYEGMSVWIPLDQVHQIGETAEPHGIANNLIRESEEKRRAQERGENSPSNSRKFEGKSDKKE
jgi:hypothetical protein